MNIPVSKASLKQLCDCFLVLFGGHLPLGRRIQGLFCIESLATAVMGLPLSFFNPSETHLRVCEVHCVFA